MFLSAFSRKIKYTFSEALFLARNADNGYNAKLTFAAANSSVIKSEVDPTQSCLQELEPVFFQQIVDTLTVPLPPQE